MRYWIATFLFLTLLPSYARLKPHSLQDNEFRIKKVKVKKELNPRKALLYSALFPGLGQIYTRKYVKSVIFSGLFITTLSSYIFFNKEYNTFVDVFNDRQSGVRTDQFTVAGGSAFEYSDETIRNAVDFYKKRRENMMAYMIGIYLINLLDAFVGANMYGYDVSDDLSLAPYVDISRNSVGMSLNVKL